MVFFFSEVEAYFANKIFPNKRTERRIVIKLAHAFVMVGHPKQTLAASFEDSMDFFKGDHGGDRMFEDMGAINEIKFFIQKRQIMDITNNRIIDLSFASMFDCGSDVLKALSAQKPPLMGKGVADDEYFFTDVRFRNFESALSDIFDLGNFFCGAVWGGRIKFGYGITCHWLLEGEAYDDILTLAVVFVLYFIVESINGSGVIFVLVFGLVLGNGVRIAKLLRIKRTIETTEIMKKFHSQMSFFIKTFFFIYLGLIMTFNNPGLIIHSLVLSVLLLFSRYLAVFISSIGNRTLLANRRLLTTMFPRGLSAAVLAQIIVDSDIPNASVYLDIIIAIILVTVIISAIGIPIFTRSAHKEESQQRM